jgi:hypothetical protein
MAAVTVALAPHQALAEAQSLMPVVVAVEAITMRPLAQAVPVAGEMAAHLRMPQVRLARLTPAAVAVAEETVLLAPQAALAVPAS